VNEDSDKMKGNTVCVQASPTTSRQGRNNIIQYKKTKTITKRIGSKPAFQSAPQQRSKDEVERPQALDSVPASQISTGKTTQKELAKSQERLLNKQTGNRKRRGLFKRRNELEEEREKKSRPRRDLGIISHRKKATEISKTVKSLHNQATRRKRKGIGERGKNIAWSSQSN